LTLVVPCYNEEEALPATLEALRGLLRRLVADGQVRLDSHVLLVDDGSRDGTWAVIAEQAERHPEVRGLKLSRNRGHQNALLAGLHHAAGDAVVSLDADLQDDIEAIPRMLEAFRAGSEIVYGVRDDRSTDAALKRWTAEGYYRALRLMGGAVVFNHADFRLMGRRALGALAEFSEVNLFLRGIVPLLGFRTSVVTYRRLSRQAGSTKYPIPRLFALAVDGVTSFSAAPLRAITFLGLAASLMSVALAAWVLWSRLIANNAIPGWASTVLPLFLMSGVQLLALGVIGEYVAKLYLESKRRPAYIIEATAGGTAPARPAPDHHLPTHVSRA